MQRGRPVGGVIVAGALVAGFVVSHWLTYLIVVPHAHDRGRLLEITGHGYWPLAVVVASALGLSALVMTARRAVTQRRDADLGWQPVRPLVARLAGMQVLAFVLLETIERLSSGSADLQFVLHATFLVGLVVQIIVATGLGIFLSGFARAAAFIARSTLTEPAVRHPTLIRPPGLTAAPLRLLGLAPAGVRAPPAL